MIPMPENNIFHMDDYIYLRKNAAALLNETFNSRTNNYEPFSPVSLHEWEQRLAEQTQPSAPKGLVLPVNHWRLTKELMKMRRQRAL